MQITTGENARLRWLLKAVSDKRPILQCVHVNGSVTAAADGFSVAVANLMAERRELT